MKLKELTEHETSMRPNPMDKQQIERHLEDAKRLDLTIGAQDTPVFSVFVDKLDSNHHVLVLTLRTEQTLPVGYLVLARPHSSTRWQIVDVQLEAPLRGRGIITNLYRGLSSAGYKLISGDVLSPQAERVWMSLGKAGLAKVLDNKTGEVLPFNDSPIGSGNMVTGQKPQYYWVTEGEKVLTTYHRGGILSEKQAADWLSGIEVCKENSHLYGVNTGAIHGDE